MQKFSAFVRIYVPLAAHLFSWTQVSSELVNCQYLNAGSNCNYAGFFPCCASRPEFDERTGVNGSIDDLIGLVAHHQPVGTGYNPNVASPALWEGTLGIGLHVRSVQDIDQRKQHYFIQYEMRSFWRDCRLTHNCSYINMNGKHPLFVHFWNPPFSIAEREHTLPGMLSTNMEIDPDGLIQYSSSHADILKCVFVLDKFPFDTQYCTITISLPQVPRVVLGWNAGIGTGGLDLPLDQIGEWIIENPSVEQVILGKTWDGHTINGVRADFSLRRDSIVQIRQYVLPTISFWFASWCGLWIDEHAVPARTMMGVVPLLILISKMNSFSESLPASVGMNRVEQFMMVTLTLLCLHLLEYSMVNYSVRRSAYLKDHPEPHMRCVMPATPIWIKFEHFYLAHVNQKLETHVRWASVVVFVSFTLVLFVF